MCDTLQASQYLIKFGNQNCRRPNRVSSSGLNQLEHTKPRPCRCSVDRTEDRARRQQGWDCKAGHKGHPNAAARRRAPMQLQEDPCSCFLQWTSPVFTGADHLLPILLHWQRRPTVVKRGDTGETPPARSIPDHLSNSYFLFFQLGLWVNHRMLQTVSQIIRYFHPTRQKVEQPKFAVDKTF